MRVSYVMLIVSLLTTYPQSKAKKSPACLKACHSFGSQVAPARPNHSLKRSDNGRPRRPSSAGPSAHFALAVQRVPPLSPAYLER